MQSEIGLRRQFRALLTEVLPHELPLIFTNDFFYLSNIENISDAGLAETLRQIRTFPNLAASSYTKPYNYHIRKDRQGSTELSLMASLKPTRGSLVLRPLR